MTKINIQSEVFTTSKYTKQGNAKPNQANEILLFNGEHLCNDSENKSRLLKSTILLYEKITQQMRPEEKHNFIRDLCTTWLHQKNTNLEFNHLASSVVRSDVVNPDYHAFVEQFKALCTNRGVSHASVTRMSSKFIGYIYLRACHVSSINERAFHKYISENISVDYAKASELNALIAKKVKYSYVKHMSKDEVRVILSDGSVKGSNNFIYDEELSLQKEQINKQLQNISDKTKLTSEKNLLEQDVKRKDQEITLLRGTIEEKNKANYNLLQQNSELSENGKALNSKLIEVKNNAFNTAHNLQQQLFGVQSSMRATQIQYSNLQKDVNIKDQELLNVRNDLTGTQNKLQQASSHIDGLQHEISQKQLQIEATHKIIQQQQNDLQQSVAERDYQINNLQKLSAQLEQERKASSQHLTEKDEALHNVSLLSKEKTEMFNKLTQAKNEVVLLKQNVDDLTRRIGEANQHTVVNSNLPNRLWFNGTNNTSSVHTQGYTNNINAQSLQQHNHQTQQTNNSILQANQSLLMVNNGGIVNPNLPNQFGFNGTNHASSVHTQRYTNNANIQSLQQYNHQIQQPNNSMLQANQSLPMINNGNSISPASVTCGVLDRSKVITSDINKLKTILSPNAQKCFASLLDISSICGQITNDSPIVSGDLDGSAGRELLLGIQSGIITLPEQAFEALARVLEFEANVMQYVNKNGFGKISEEVQASFQNNTNIQNDLANIATCAIFQKMHRPLIFLGDVLHDRFSCNKDVMKYLGERLHQNGAVFILGNHDVYEASEGLEKASGGKYAYNTILPLGWKYHERTVFVNAHYDTATKTLYIHNGFYQSAKYPSKFSTAFGDITASNIEDFVREVNKIEIKDGSFFLARSTDFRPNTQQFTKHLMNYSGETSRNPDDEMCYGRFGFMRNVRVIHGHDGHHSLHSDIIGLNSRGDPRLWKPTFDVVAHIVGAHISTENATLLKN